MTHLTIDFKFDKSGAIEYLDAFTKYIFNKDYIDYRNNLAQTTNLAYKAKFGKLATKAKHTAVLAPLDEAYNLITISLNENVVDYIDETLKKRFDNQKKEIQSSKKQELYSFIEASRSHQFGANDITLMELLFSNGGLIQTPLSMQLNNEERRIACVFDYLRYHDVKSVSLPYEYSEAYSFIENIKPKPAKMEFVDWSRLLDAVRTLHPDLDGTFSLGECSLDLKFNYKKHYDLLSKIKQRDFLTEELLRDSDKDIKRLLSSYNRLTGVKLSSDDTETYKHSKRQYIIGLAMAVTLTEMLNNDLVRVQQPK